jgi:chemotaxis signal transduction protein
VGQVAIIKHGTIALGIAVDNVSEVISVPESSLLALPPDQPGLTAAPGRSRFFKAVVQREGAAAALLDLDKLIEAVKLV